MSENEKGSGPNSELELLKARARLLGVEFSNNIGLDTLRERVAAKMAAIEGDTGDAPVTAPVAVTQVAPPPLVAPAEPEAPNPLTLRQQIFNESMKLIREVPDDFDDDIEEEAPLPEAAAQPAVVQAPLVQQPVAAAPAPAPVVIKPIAPIVEESLPDPSKSVSTGSAIPETAERPLTLRQQIFNENMKLIRVRIQNLDPKKKDLQGEIFAVSNKFLGTVKRFVPYGDTTDDGWHLPYVIYKELVSRKFLQITTTKDRQTKQVKVLKRWVKEFAFEVLEPLTDKELKALAAAQAAAGSIEAVSDQIL